MAKKVIDPTDSKAVKSHVANMVASPGYQIVLQYLNIERENIINEGKEARKEEKLIRKWSELAGFDRVVAMINKLANLPVDDEQSPYSEE